MNIIVTAVIVVLVGFVVWFGVSAIIKIWRPSVEIAEFVDDKDGSSGRRAQAIIDFILREAPDIHRKADLSAISVGPKLEVPMVSRRDPGLERIESLDIKVKDVQLNWVFGIMRALAKPSCEVSGRVMQGQSSTEIVVELTDSSIRDAPIVVSIRRTADANNDTEKAATAAAYELLHAMYQHFAKDKARVPGSWMSLERFTEGLRSLQAYRLAASFGDAGAPAYLNTAIEQLQQVKQIDPGYNDGLYYLGVAYFEKRDEEKAIEVFKELLEREPKAPQSLEARFYLGYSWFRTYSETGMANALNEYDGLRTDLEALLRDELPEDERKRALGLLAETYSQIATTQAHLAFRLRTKLRPDQERDAKSQESASYHFQAAKEYAEKAEKHLTCNKDSISLDIRKDVEWRRLNALGIAEFSFAVFDQPSEYQEHCEKALENFDRALESSPLNYSVLENKGELYRDNLYCGYDLEKAKALFLQSAGLKPEDLYAPQQLGMIYDTLRQESLKKSADEKAKGNDEQAKENEKKMIEYYRKAVALGSEQAKLRLEELHIPVEGKADEAKPKQPQVKSQPRHRVKSKGKRLANT